MTSDAMIMRPDTGPYILRMGDGPATCLGLGGHSIAYIAASALPM